MRRLMGVCLFDVPRYLKGLCPRGRTLGDRGWLHICNRDEVLEKNPSGPGVLCRWQWTSDLHACHVLPWLGRYIYQQALRDWPVHLNQVFRTSSRPEVSFVIPHRGADRLPLLLATIRSIAAQEDAAVECIVVEQSNKRSVTTLPDGTRYLHLPHPDDPHSWRKSWAYNVGANEARSPLIVCHDADILVPAKYASEILSAFKESSLQAAFMQRFLFCFTQQQTDEFLETAQVPISIAPERVRQNWKGGTLAIRRDAFFEIGGFDETFVDWTGEDLEFYDRCGAISCSRYGYVPFIHLWHPPQPSKSGNKREANLAHTRRVMAVPREDRIKRLMEMRRLPQVHCTEVPG